MEDYTSACPSQSNPIGEVMIADDVVAVIAALAVTETEGVASMAGNITYETVGKLSVRALSKGVKIEMRDGIVNADVNFIISYGYSIPKVSAAVQDKIKSAIENMTGLSVGEVNVKVAGVNIENAK